MAAPSPSFIPKQPAQGQVKKRRTRKVYLLAYISFVLFFGTLLSAAVTFFYKVNVESQLENKKQELIEQRQQFNEADIERLKELSLRLKAAEKLLDNHVSVVSLLEALENSTLETVQLTSLSYTHENMGEINMDMNIDTDNFNSVLFQRQIVEANPILAGATFDTFKSTKDALLLNAGIDEGTVTFTVMKELTPSEIPYRPLSNNQSRDNNQPNPNDSQTDSLNSNESADPFISDNDTNQ